MKYAFAGAFKTPLCIYVGHVHSIMQTSELQDGCKCAHTDVSHRQVSIAAAADGTELMRIERLWPHIPYDSCIANELYFFFYFFPPTRGIDKAAAFCMILPRWHRNTVAA